MKFLVILLIPLGLVGGLAAGHFAAPAPPVVEADMEDDANHAEDEHSEDSQPSAKKHAAPKKAASKGSEDSEYAKLDKHFVVPVIEGETVSALIVVTMALEVDAGTTDLVYLHEPKIRDEFLSVLFAHGRSGAFSGAFSDSRLMEDLRLSLNDAAGNVIGKTMRQVLLTSIIRQDM